MVALQAAVAYLISDSDFFLIGATAYPNLAVLTVPCFWVTIIPT